ncbi:hypothetical protein TSA6c_08525 [Azospirillum sp. TSA6c]|uniref:hypothetical protein n=1 Tax=Azospirillum sp. TSA6c TaxID=709813 RepID=UPI000D61A643|nr:hypothetical protein [Azospirillum sp. TSA6c]PWC46809.1 hypothetical protein TSA6c_08525 [Azospirillum sp. TSA6c]
MMKEKSLVDVPGVCLLRSREAYELLIDCLVGSNAVKPAKLYDAVKATMLAQGSTRFRHDDIDAALSAAWTPKVDGARNNLHTLDFLMRIAKDFLMLDGGQYRVHASRLLDYHALIKDIHPAFLIGVLQAGLLHSGDVPVAALVSGLAEQCPLALPPPPPERPFADNHVHLGGVSVSNHPLMAFALGAADLDENHRVPDNYRAAHALTRNGRYGLLGRHYAILTRHIVDWASRSGDPDFDRKGLARQFREGAQAEQRTPVEVLAESLGTAHRRTIRQDLLLQMCLHVERKEAGIAFQLLVTLVCYIFLTQPPNAGHLRTCLLAFIHATHLIRSAMIMDGIGLLAFRTYFGSKAQKVTFKDPEEKKAMKNMSRDAKKKPKREVFSDQQRWQFLIGDGNLVDAKLAKIDLADLQKTARDIANLPVRATTPTAPHPWLRYHLSLHFLRSSVNTKTSTSRFTDTVTRPRPKLGYARHAAARRRALQNAREWRKLLGKTSVAGEVLIEGRFLTQEVTSWIRSFDVAGDENNLPVEVFAPALRLLREKPLIQYVRGLRMAPRRNLSIHAGEDFSCLLSGMRHVDETVLFCNLGENDRLGHALALGVVPHVWAKRQRIAYLSVQAHLDNLVWLWRYASVLSGSVDIAGKMMPNLQRRIDFFRDKLFRDKADEMHASPETLHRAWRLRRNCPLAIQLWEAGEPVGEAPYRIPDLEERTSIKSSPEFRILRRYFYGTHEQARGVHLHLGDRGEPDEVGGWLVDYLDTGDLDLIEAIQDHLITEYDRKGIIIEACPSSNIFIGRFHDYTEHPLFRWRPPLERDLEPGGCFNRFGLRQGPATVCLNTDDPAVFPTTIASEHLLMKDAAMRRFSLSRTHAEEWIEAIRVLGVDIFKRSHQHVRYREADDNARTRSRILRA